MYPSSPQYSLSIQGYLGEPKASYLLGFKIQFSSLTEKNTFVIALFRTNKNMWAMRWRSWLRHCATSRKVVGSILDGVTGIFQGLNPSGRIVPLGSTEPLTELSTRNSS
jgi:hypothetical protein